jgi:hypothetical protein
VQTGLDAVALPNPSRGAIGANEHTGNRIFRFEVVVDSARIGVPRLKPLLFVKFGKRRSWVWPVLAA